MFYLFYQWLTAPLEVLSKADKAAFLTANPFYDTMVSIFNVFQYTSFRAAYAAVTALLIAFVLGPKVIDFLRRLKAGQQIRKDGPQSHLTKAGTPTMGGAVMILSLVVSALLWMDLTSSITWILVLGAIGFGGIGFLDDFLKIMGKNTKGLAAKWKMLGLFIVSGGVMSWIYFLPVDASIFPAGAKVVNEIPNLYIPFLKKAVLDLGPFIIPFGMIWMIGWSNAVNLTDGLDGLATGLSIMVALAFAVFAYVSGIYNFAGYLNIPFLPWGGEVTILTLALVGALIGFLWFNAHPAEVFMGDTGSLAIGGLFGLIAILIKKEVLLIILGGVFVMETMSVILQVFWFKRTGKRIFRMAPLHHHFELSGWAETKVVTRFWILGGLFAILSLSTLKLQ